MGMFIPDPSKPHLRYPRDFVQDARKPTLKLWSTRLRIIKDWNMTMARPRDIETVHSHLIEHVRLAKADVIGRLENGERDWDGLRRAVNRYIEFQTAADVLSGQTPLAR